MLATGTALVVADIHGGPIGSSLGAFNLFLHPRCWLGKVTPDDLALR